MSGLDPNRSAVGPLVEGSEPLMLLGPARPMVNRVERTGFFEHFIFLSDLAGGSNQLANWLRTKQQMGVSKIGSRRACFFTTG
jgi:hypothetical protein